MRRTPLVSCLLIVACSQPAPAPPTEAGSPVIAFIGATLLDGTGQVVPDSVLLVLDGRITGMGPAGTVVTPDGAELVDLADRWVMPGIINTHGHVGGTLGLEGGHYDEDNLLRQLSLYARYGVTTVVSLGGDGPEGVALRDAEDATLDRARLRIAGTVVTGNTPAEIRAVVEDNVALGVDLIKIRVDDNLGTGTKLTPELYRTAIDAAHGAGLPLAAHMFYLQDAKGLLAAGADFLAHSIRDQPVDEEVIAAFLETGTCLSPTLVREVSTFVYEDEPEFFADPFFLREADPAVLAALRDPARQQHIRDSPAAHAYKRALRQAQDNLATLVDAGVTVAFGTDTGPPARFQGYFEHLEVGLMLDAGLTPAQVLSAATRDAASCLGLNEVGTLEPGKWADFVVLGADPLVDGSGFRTIESVWIAGNRVPGTGE